MHKGIKKTINFRPIPVLWFYQCFLHTRITIWAESVIAVSTELRYTSIEWPSAQHINKEILLYVYLIDLERLVVIYSD